ncbi:phosphatase PAP2 family protein [Hymenobacter siberiensis]|jgi:undecaprenyl-diphosphatase|uniref:phosphatase PAP2 family protein n=1 Tax=Hymenobacter siberiensis TaxID=2848396 RepID=UPI001C1E5339|nr:phosphatase PAP2 family protein [Hymenobacter siberiensis]MBU6121823.1 phosphatase PAP2 family protein [Hymenobacter siberiensis]
MLEAIQYLDRQLLLAINHAHHPVLDAVMAFASNRLVWFPVYAVLIGWLMYHFRWRAALLLPLVIAAVGLADSITSRLFKPYFGRPRPCHDASLAHLLHLPDGCGGQFGFLSSHAANSMALAVFLAVVLPPRRFRGLKIVVFGWFALLSYSRMYLGAHYPTDVLGGAAVGALMGWLAAVAYRRWMLRWWPAQA